MTIDRREFLKSTALAAAAAAAGAFPIPARSGPTHPGGGMFDGCFGAGHLAGISMAPLFLADALGYFAGEGLEVALAWIPSSDHAVTALTSGAVDFVHNPFTSVRIAIANGAPLKIVGGADAGRLVLLARKDAGIGTISGLARAAGRRFKLGTLRASALERALYRKLADTGLAAGDLDIAYFCDPFSLTAAFEAGAVDLVTHVEPYATRIIDELGAVPLATISDAWAGKARESVVSVRADFIERYPVTVERYVRALSRAAEAIEADTAGAARALDRGRYYKVSGETLEAALRPGRRRVVRAGPAPGWSPRPPA